MRKIKIWSSIFFVAFACYFCLSPINARWATYEEAPAEIEIYNSDIVVDKQGKVEEVIEKQIKILNETGRNNFSVERLHFNENSEKIEIIEAKAVIQGKAYIVPKEMIEIKPLASDIKGFDQLFQILISYPHICVGAQVYLKYKVTILKQPLPDYFSLKYYYGEGASWKKAKIKVRSEQPFDIMVNDPNGHLTVNKGKAGRYQTLEITSKKPAYHNLMNEPSTNQVPDHLKTWVQLSTYEKFDDISKGLAKEYEEVIYQDLPPLQESIRKAAATIAAPVDQINMVTSLLSEKIRYMGDWRTVEGKFSPHSLHTVAENGVGDCKDFAACTVAILKALGFKAQVALVIRGVAYLPLEKTLPTLSNFNHAIVKATTKNGKIFWIDPTNFTSMADGIYSDIANRPALILDSCNPSFEHIPDIDYQHSKVIFEDKIEIKDNGVLSNTGSIKLCGEQAQESTGAGLSHSLQSIEESVIKLLTEETSPTRQKVTLPPLNSRIVKDFKIDYAYEQENNLLLTNAGPGILLRYFWSQPFIDTSDCQKGTTFIGLPSTLMRKITIKDIDEKEAVALTYEFKSPWVNASRVCRVVEGGIEINEQISILKSFITAEEVHSKQYKDLKELIKKYCNKIAVIVSKKDKNKNHPSPLAMGS